MGSGKGSPEYWGSAIKPGRIIYELSGVSEDVAKKAMAMAAHKMPVPTRVVATTES